MSERDEHGTIWAVMLGLMTGIVLYRTYRDHGQDTVIAALTARVAAIENSAGAKPDASDER